MKLKYKKLVIVITVVTLALSFFILTLIPTGGSGPQSAEDADLLLNKNEDINKLIMDYYTAKKTVDMEALGNLVSDPNQIPKEKFTALAKYVEDYSNINCYVIQHDELDIYRVYARYDMKLKNIDTLALGLSAFLVTVTSDGKHIIYLSALDEVQEEFITSADKNPEIIKLAEEVNQKHKEMMEKDGAYKQFYQKLDKEMQAAMNEAGNATASPAPVANTPAAASQAPAAKPQAPASQAPTANSQAPVANPPAAASPAPAANPPAAASQAPAAN